MPDAHPSLFSTSGGGRWPHLLPDWMRAQLIADARPVVAYDRGAGRKLRVSVVQAPDHTCWFASFSYDLSGVPDGVPCGGGSPPDHYRGATAEEAAAKVARHLMGRIPALPGAATRMRALLAPLDLPARQGRAA